MQKRKKAFCCDTMNGNLSYRLHFCSTNRGTSKGFPVPPAFQPQPAGTLFCLPTGPGPAAGSSLQELYPDRASRCSFLSGLPFIWLGKNSRLISEIWPDPCSSSRRQWDKAVSELCRCELCAETKLLSWSSGTTQTLCLFSSWTQAEGGLQQWKVLLLASVLLFFFVVFFFQKSCTS